jgi:hypothetical protein
MEVMREKMLGKQMQSVKPGLKMAGTWKYRTRAVSGMLLAMMFGAGVAAMAQAQGKLAAAPPVTYNNRFEVYGGLNFMNFQAGQNLPTRMNMGGGEILGTYWLTKRVGLAADYRGEAGTTPVFPSAPTGPSLSTIDRPLVYMNMGMLGAQLRGPKNQFAALNLHGYFGVAHGVFDGGTGSVPPQNVGLYTNRTKPIAAVGGSIDVNRSKNFAVRLSPDLIFEHFGTETREFFAISAGVVYRFGNKD